MRSAQTRKYDVLTNILDEYVREGAALKRRKSFFDTSTGERQNQARSRAHIHLYLAATYGVIDFEEREHTITDASNDGGIDAYHIDIDNKIIDIIQSKFRVGPDNFESKNISPEEILSVDLNRILEGHRTDKYGRTYNGHILAFIEKIQKIPDIVRYNVKVTILANVKREQYPLVERLFPGDQTNIVNFDRCYNELVLPTIRGEQHYTSSMRLQIDLSNKSKNSLLSAEIPTAHGSSEVTVVLVPTIEIAKITFRYKNSILRYNPRSYLEFREQRTNEGIRSSIVDIDTGEFAILNNGITIVSDETYVNQRVGSQNRAHVEIVNPQIINGGQTAFTLSRIYEETSHDDIQRTFAGKEVVLRIITLPQIDEDSKHELIRSISSATNSQTTVSNIDRSASNDVNRKIAEDVFRMTGLLYEPKRGEYADALRKRYVDRTYIVERSIFTRLMHVACGRYGLAVERKMMRNTGGVLPPILDDSSITAFAELHEIYSSISQTANNQAADKILTDIAFSVFARALRLSRTRENGVDELAIALKDARALWPDFVRWAHNAAPEFVGTRSVKNDDEKKRVFSQQKWKRSSRYPHDVQTFVDLVASIQKSAATETVSDTPHTLQFND